MFTLFETLWNESSRGKGGFSFIHHVLYKPLNHSSCGIFGLLWILSAIVAEQSDLVYQCTCLQLAGGRIMGTVTATAPLKAWAFTHTHTHTVKSQWEHNDITVRVTHGIPCVVVLGLYSETNVNASPVHLHYMGSGKTEPTVGSTWGVKENDGEENFYRTLIDSWSM
jgi:hypothetical protein